MTRSAITSVTVMLLGALSSPRMHAQASSLNDVQVLTANATDSPAELRLGRIFQDGTGLRFLAAEVRSRRDAAITSLVLRVYRVGSDGSVKQSQGRQLGVNVAARADELIAIQLSQPPFPIEDGDRVVALIVETSGFGAPDWKLDGTKARDLVLNAAGSRVPGRGRLP